MAIVAWIIRFTFGLPVVVAVEVIMTLVDPVGGAKPFAGLPKPDLVLVTHIHGDHFDAANGDKPATIIRPKLMTAKAERELCGKCHAAHDGTSASPPGLGYPWNSGNAGRMQCWEI